MSTATVDPGILSIQCVLPRPANMYQALIEFAEAHRQMLEALQEGTGKLPITGTWNAHKANFRWLVGQH